jgi:inhibitor of KinA
MLYKHPRYRVMGDGAMLVEVGDTIHISVNQKVRRLFVAVKETLSDSLLDMVPAYCSLLLIFDPLKTSVTNLQKTMDGLFRDLDDYDIPAPATFEIPVVYGEEYGPDLDWVSRYHNISVEEAISLHTETTYHVFMIGFSPGFPYLGELPEALETPRKETPRTTVPKGSVGLALKQTGIYPSPSPGGWQIIGRTPLNLFDPLKNPPSLLQMGDRVRFFQISEEEMNHWPR